MLVFVKCSCYFPGEYSLGKSEQVMEGESRKTGGGHAGCCAVSGWPAGNMILLSSVG